MQCTNCNRLCHLFPGRGKEEDMTVDQIQRFIGQVRQSPVKVKRIKLLGGEPLLAPDFVPAYHILREAILEGLVQKVKIETNGILPRPDVPDHPAIQWAGKPPHKKRHLPTLWSPTDFGLPITAPCSMPRICGISLDAYGYSLCSMCPMMYRIFQREYFYREEFPYNWREVFASTIQEVCIHCVFAGPEEWRHEHLYPINDTPEEATCPTATWAHNLKRFSGKTRKERW
jgi:hypothetical protein